jgi:hypothetical protein
MILTRTISRFVHVNQWNEDEPFTGYFTPEQANKWANRFSQFWTNRGINLKRIDKVDVKPSPNYSTIIDRATTY